MRWFPLAVLAALMLAGCTEDGATAPTLDDADGDGFPDAVELKAGSDPRNATSLPDLAQEMTVTFADAGSITLGADTTTATGSCGGNVEMLAVNQHGWTVEAPANATDAWVSHLTVMLTLTDPANVDSDIYVLAGGQIIAQATTFNAETGPTDTATFDGALPPGELVLEVRGCSGSGGYTLDGEATLMYVPSFEDYLAM
jgi:hypothetical protein